MTPTVAELLARKQWLLEQLQDERRLNEQDKIERLLVGINAVLNRLDVADRRESDAALGDAADAKPHQPTIRYLFGRLLRSVGAISSGYSARIMPILASMVSPPCSTARACTST